MTVTAAPSVNNHVGNGVTTVFAYGFKILQASDLRVTVDSIVVTNYTVSGVREPSGGSITFSIAPANGAAIRIARNMPILRGTDYQFNGSLPSDTLNDDQDSPVMMIQQVDEKVGRAVRAPDTDLPLNDMPTAASRANKLLAFDSNGQPQAISSVAGTATQLALDLLASSGSSLVGFIQSGTGAVARTMQEKTREQFSVFDFMTAAQKTDVTARTLTQDVTTAVQAAITAAETLVAAGSSAAEVFFPPGRYRLSAALTVKQSRITLRGAGMGQTELVSQTDYGDTIVFGRTDRFAAFANFQYGNWIQDIRLTTNNVDTTTGAHVLFSRCLEFGAHNVAAVEKYGGLLVEGGAWGFFTNVFCNTGNYFAVARVGSFGMLFRGCAAPGSPFGNNRDRPAAIFVSNFEAHAYSSNRRLDYGILVQACDGIWFSNGHCGFSTTACMGIVPNVPTDPVISVQCSNVYCDGTGNTSGTQGPDYGLLIQDGGAHTGFFGKHIFTGCHFGLNNANGAGVYLNAASARDINFVGGSSSDNYGAGVWIGRGREINFTGFNVVRNNLANNGSGCVRIFNDSSKVNWIGGSCAGDSLTAVDPAFGLSIENTANDIQIVGVNFAEITGNNIQNSSSGRRIACRENQTEKGMTIASAAALDLPLDQEVFLVSGTTSITSITATSSLRRRRVTLIFSGILTVTNGNNLSLVGGNVTTSTASTLTLVCDGVNWYRAGSTP